MPSAAKMTCKVYKRAFLGKELLQTCDVPIKGRYSWACITGERDHNEGTWFGLIHIMRDPADLGEQWLSQTAWIANSNRAFCLG